MAISYRKELNLHHKAFKEALTGGASKQTVMDHFLLLHGMLHSKQINPDAPWSYEDELLDNLTKNDYRWIPDGFEHSIAWIIWHLSRIEDITMNLLVGGKSQIFELGRWQERTQAPIKHTGNGFGLPLVKAFSEQIDVAELRLYRYAVGKATREVVRALTVSDFKRKTPAEGLQRILDEGAVAQEGFETVAYWGRCNVAELLLMPPTRHTIVHWNEVRKIKRRFL